MFKIPPNKKDKTEKGIILSKIINPKSKNGPFLDNFILNSLYREGKTANKTLDPSRGGIGSKLNNIKIVLIIIKANKN